MDFQKKKKKVKKKIFFFFLEIHKLRVELLAVVKVPKKRYEKQRGVKKRQKNNKSLRNVQIKHA